ncbi:ribonuclease III [Peptoniphilus catoniae]|uniref:ribonuclease III n=1 Tax=Peptoniphilus catoniae TaxID=1660341 RepID=UPI0010FE1341|nr:ribonuclease III [Peptoniphilus catoniae]
MKGNLEELINKLNYEYKDLFLLKTALTHSSYANEIKSSLIIDNERLEFLGDAVLDLVIGEYFFNYYINLREGDLSKLRSQVVSEDSLFQVAKSINLGAYIRLGHGEIKNKGNLKPSILSDCLEAIIGSIYMDSGFENAKKVVLYLFATRLDDIKDHKGSKNYKSLLQEYLQKQNSQADYILVKEEGPDNNKTFYTHVVVNKKTIGSGEGKSKKKSEQNAAKDALKKLGVVNE